MRPRIQRAVRWAASHLSDEHQADFRELSDVVSAINRQYREATVNRGEQDQFVVGVWLRPITRGEFERLELAPREAVFDESSWDFEEAFSASAGPRKTVLALFGIYASSAPMAATRTLDYLMAQLNTHRLRVDAVRVEVEYRHNLEHLLDRADRS